MPIKNILKRRENDRKRSSLFRKSNPTYQKKWRENNPNYNKEYNIKHPRNNTEYYKKWRETHPEYFKNEIYRKKKRQSKRDDYLVPAKRLKMIARTTLNNKILQGLIKKNKYCDKCSSSINIEAHHPDYNKAQKVVWLCRYCHRKQHDVKLSNVKNNYVPRM